MTRREWLTGAVAAGLLRADDRPATARQDWLRLVQSHLEGMAEHGTDRYGPVKTPMWMASLDLKTKSYPESEPMARAGRRVYRDIASPFGSNIYWDQPQLVAAHAVTKLTGKAAYRRSADAYIRSFLQRAIDPMGLFEWGNHRYYDAYKDKAAHFVGGAHEIRPIPPAWDLFWSINPEATEREIRMTAKRHVIDPATGFFSRHDEAKGAHAFIEAGGILAESFCWLYAKTRDESLADLALKVAEYSYRHRDPETGLIENNPPVTRWDKHVSTTEVGLWAGSLLRAADLSGRAEFAKMAADGVSAYLNYGYDQAAKEYYGQLRVKDGTPVLKDDPVPGPEEYWPGNYADIWNANFPAHDYPMAMAETCVQLYRRTRSGHYAEAIERWSGVVAAHPAPEGAKDGRGGYAELFGRAIHFLVRASSVTSDAKHRRLAESLALDAKRILFNGEMFRGHAGEDRYDTVDGVGYLLLSLLHLQTGKAPAYRGFGF